MSRIAYVNGRYVRHRDAAVHIEDRGYQFADGVYEVCEVRGGFIIDMTRHLDRLGRSLNALAIAWPTGRRPLERIVREVVRVNRVRDGLVYLQVTRGVARRDHVFPDPAGRPALVVTARRSDPAAAERRAEAGVAVITVSDNRWERVDIKTIGLLPNALARQKAREAGAYEAVFVDPDGTVKEGAATNVWMLGKDGVLVTRPADSGILKGITRTTLIDLLNREGIAFKERAFTVAEALAAREVFITSATSTVLPVVSIDGRPVANGHPGALSLKLRRSFLGVAERTPTC